LRVQDLCIAFGPVYGPDFATIRCPSGPSKSGLRGKSRGARKDPQFSKRSGRPSLREKSDVAQSCRTGVIARMTSRSISGILRRRSVRRSDLSLTSATYRAVDLFVHLEMIAAASCRRDVAEPPPTVAATLGRAGVSGQSERASCS